MHICRQGLVLAPVQALEVCSACEAYTCCTLAQGSSPNANHAECWWLLVLQVPNLIRGGALQCKASGSHLPGAQRVEDLASNVEEGQQCSAAGTIKGLAVVSTSI